MISLSQVHTEEIPGGGRLSPPLCLFCKGEYSWEELRECGSAAFHCLHFPGLVAPPQGLLPKFLEPLCEKSCKSSKQGL